MSKKHPKISLDLASEIETMIRDIIRTDDPTYLKASIIFDRIYKSLESNL